MAEIDEDSFYPDPDGPNAEKARLGPPDRWIYCPAVGSVIAKHFLPFKTPLCKLYDEYIEGERYLFHPKDIFANPLKGADPGAKIGLWIDLTKTNRYYSKKEVESRGCVYIKMAMKGHKEVPSEAQTEFFCNLVQDFLLRNPKDVVGVHCTHGFNRTGFLITAYLATCLDWAVDAAVHTFAKHRHNGIYKQDYIDELFRRYGDEEDKIMAPARPGWESGSADESNVESFPFPDNEPPTSSGQPLFMSGAVPRVTYVADSMMRGILQSKIAQMCGSTRDGFPGSQPVSMERSPENNNLHLLAENDYMVSWKADGTRYMVLIDDEDSVFAFDRDNNVFRIPFLYFPHRKEKRHIRHTLLDCEMIIDKVVDDSGMQQTVPRLLVYDIVKFEENNVGACDFKTRLFCIRREIIGPRKEAMQRGIIRRENEPISVRVKDFWELEAVPKFFSDKFTKNVGHEIDGLIFQPVHEAYRPGRVDTILKWKPPSHNSIDFKLQIRKICNVGELPEYVGLLFVQHEATPVAQLKATKKLLPYDNKIVECNFVNGKWQFMRERTDKSLPNSMKTAKAVFNSIRYPISKTDLINFVESTCISRAKKRNLDNCSSNLSSKRAHT